MVKYDLYKVKLQVFSWLQYMTQHKHRDPSTVNRVTHYRPEYVVPND